MRQLREPLTGFVASITVKGSGDLASMVEPLQSNPHIMDYFWVGVLGALGGLFVKVLWSLLKKRFQILKNIDQ